MKKHSNIKTTDVAIVRIRSFIRANGYTNLAFAKLADVDEGTIRGLFKDNPDPRMTTLRKMESVIPPEYKYEPDQDNEQPTQPSTPSNG